MQTAGALFRPALPTVLLTYPFFSLFEKKKIYNRTGRDKKRYCIIAVSHSGRSEKLCRVTRKTRGSLRGIPRNFPAVPEPFSSGS